MHVQLAARASEPPGMQRGSAAYNAVLSRIRRFARDDTAPILLQGESGTGKTRLARLIHELSPRAAGPFRHVILSAMDDGVAASELFGHVRGAFTDARQARIGQFASANGGTLFLDEIGKASPAVQARLLDVVESGRFSPLGSDRELCVNVRIVAATNIDLEELVERRQFLRDLRARLATFRIVVPPLRKRRADIPMLASECVARHAASAGYANGPPAIDPRLMAALRRARWPDNIRQLDATVHRLLLEADGAPIITLAHCLDDLAFLVTRGVDGAGLTLEQIDRAVATGGGLSGAGRLLGMNRKTLRMKREKLRGGASQLDAGDPGGMPQQGDVVAGH